jgi:exosortase
MVLYSVKSNFAAPNITLVTNSWVPWFLVTGIFWILILNQQRLEWSVNPIYSYGWAVPALVAYLFWERWQSRPTPGGILQRVWFYPLIAIVLITFALLRVIQEANPDWVKVNWIIAGLWMTYVFLGLARSGGVRYAVHFAFPLLFAFTALPWPVAMEETLMQGLMRLNAGWSAEILTLLGTPALAVGNLIQIAEQWVNVEEACSGITSLQTAFMLALFMGEFNRLSWPRRGLLLVGSSLIALGLNLMRTLTLTYLAKEGALQRWHDTIGNLTMVVCLALIWLLSLLLTKLGVRRPKMHHAPNEVITTPSGPFTIRAMCLNVAILGLSELATTSWYSYHELQVPPPVNWVLNWPKEAPQFTQTPFGDRVQALLKYNRATNASWQSRNGSKWQIYILEWDPGRVSKFLSSAHYPTVCLPATGLKLVKETEQWIYSYGGLELPFNTFIFDEQGRNVYVFHAVVEDRPRPDGTALSYRQVTSSERIISVFRGERNLGQRVIGIALRGPSSTQEARDEVTTILQKTFSLAPSANIDKNLLRL